MTGSMTGSTGFFLIPDGPYLYMFTFIYVNIYIYIYAVMYVHAMEFFVKTYMSSYVLHVCISPSHH